MDNRERWAEAQGPQTNLSRSGADTSATLYEAAFSHMRAGKNLDAQLCCERALALDPNHADSLHLMGLLSFQTGQYDHAAEWISRAIQQDAKPGYLSSLGITLQHQSRFEEAAKTFGRALHLRPDDVHLWTNLGISLIRLGRPADAVVSFQQALKFNPSHWDAAIQCGGLFHERGRFEEALRYFNLCDQLRPDHAPTIRMRAVTLHKLKRHQEALADSRRAHELDPADADACNTIGVTLHALRREEEALQWFDLANELRPNFADALNYKAFTLVQVRRFDEAFAIFNRVRSFDPDHAETEFNLALLQMLLGNFEAGLVGREARRKLLPFAGAYPTTSKPMWLGQEPLDGKTILVYADEGLGDSIQFARYLPMLAAQGARVILVVEGPVRALLSGVSGVSQCLLKSGSEWPAFDMHCAITSLPLAFGTRLDGIPSASCLPPPAASRVQAWNTRLGLHDRLRVGLVWSGNPHHINDHNRSVSLREMSRLLDLDATFVSLQKDPRAEDRALLRERAEIIDPTADLTDFVETAALVSCLDLIITVDTSVAHLAAALGRPVWILLPYVPDWRWLLDRDDSPWYPSVRLFRQTETRDYADVLDQVRANLHTLISRI
jgi:tetratricopeptide (TPR) repeat protein